MEAVTTAPAYMNPHNSSFFHTIPVTNTFDEDLDLDVLIVPGGPGVRAPNMEAVENFIAKMFPKVRFLPNICTGSGLSAKAGVLDDHLSTTNKAAWHQITSWGPNVDWVAPARYVVDGKIWSSSGVSGPPSFGTALVAAALIVWRSADYLWGLPHGPLFCRRSYW